MLGTQMHPLTFSIIIVQSLVLFAQLLFYISRPSDTSRGRFLILIVIYIIYNIILGILPSRALPLSLWSQYLIGYTCGTTIAFYFIFYTYKEFDIYPFQYEILGIKSFVYILLTAFVLMFVMPYYVLGVIELSRLLFLSVLLLLAFAFLVWMGKALIKRFRQKEKESLFFRYRIIAGYLGLFSLALFPLMLLFSESQWVKVAVLNFGFTLMMITYIVDFIYQRRIETALLASLNSSAPKKTMYINDSIIIAVLNALEKFEADKGYLNKVTVQTLSKKIGTNSKYLSLIINSHKGQSFTNYLSDLRIAYVKLRLDTDPAFRHYTLQAIANEIGYTSAEAFANAFVKREHIKPLAYIEQLKKGE